MSGFHKFSGFYCYHFSKNFKSYNLKVFQNSLLNFTVPPPPKNTIDREFENKYVALAAGRLVFSMEIKFTRSNTLATHIKSMLPKDNLIITGKFINK